MKQYCRYCNNLVTGNGIYCCEKQTVLSEAYTKTVNHCKDFEFNEVDAYDFNSVYKPRGAYRPRETTSLIAEQLTLEQEDNTDD